MIGYYVHHQGVGHLTRARAIAARMDEAVTGLSSIEEPAGWKGPWLTLARDDDDGPAPVDPVAGGALHWAPLGDDGLRERMAQIAAWAATARPRLVVVDVSVEVTVLLRSMGVPVVVVGMPGTRRDRPHQLAYRMATAILAPWPQDTPDLLEGGERWAAKLRAVGAISRFDGREPTAVGGGRAGARRVVVLSGRGGSGLTPEALEAARCATSGWDWTVLGPPGEDWVEDPWPLVCGADVVVTHAGQNAIADVAAARRQAIVVPQDRPHSEQRALARVLARTGLAAVEPTWPQAARWPALLEATAARDGARWERWTAGGGGAQRAAAVLTDLHAGGGEATRCASR
jgi:Glycosyltransferase family 28 C-terminal domain